MQRTISQFLHYIGWVFLFIFTATCTYLFLSAHLPPEKPWLPWVGLAVFELGTIHWLHYHKHQATNAIQAWLGLIMAVLSALAITCATGAELVQLFNGGKGLFNVGWVAYVVIVAILLNILAFIGCSISEPKHIAFLTALGQNPQHVEVRITEAKQVHGVHGPQLVAGSSVQVDELVAVESARVKKK